jgi:hypothetical protein
VVDAGRWEVGGTAMRGLGLLCRCCDVYISERSCMLKRGAQLICVPSHEIKPHRTALWFCIGANSWMEEQQYWGSLKHELSSVSKPSSTMHARIISQIEMYSSHLQNPMFQRPACFPFPYHPSSTPWPTTPIPAGSHCTDYTQILLPGR